MIRLRLKIAGKFACSVLLLSLILLSTVRAKAYTNPGKQPATRSFNEKLAHQPLAFTENRGQVTDVAGKTRPDVLFSAHNGNTDIFLSETGISYQFKKITYPEGYNAADPERQEELYKQIATQTFNFTVSLEGANPHPDVIKSDKAVTVFNYYLTQCPNGITNVGSYQRLVYQEVYPHIDWVIYSDGGRLKYDFIVKPGGDPSVIKLRIKDAESVNITTKGELVMKTRLGEIKEKAPLSFANGQPVKSGFLQYGDGTIGFDVKAIAGQELRIDPAVVWSTYFGGSAVDISFGCANDNSGHTYLTGYTASGTSIASNGFQNTPGGSNDAFLAKFDSSGYLLWATYYGNTGDDQGLGCIVDGSGNIFVTGKTTSATGLASATGMQASNGGGTDAFLVKFDATGNRLWSTFYGGSGTDNPTGGGTPVYTDASGNAYMAGTTTSTSGITTSGFQTSLAGGSSSDAFLVKFSASGSQLWGTYYGGTGAENGNACTVDGSGNVYLTGNTITSTTGIASSGYQAANGGSTDAFLVKFDASGSRLWGTYYGNTGADVGLACAADASGNIYMAGYTNSTTGITTTGTAQATAGGGNDGFLVKFTGAGGTSSRLWGTFYGGTGAEQAKTCFVDASGNVYLAGQTASTTNIASGGFQGALAGGSGNDAFIVKLNPSTGARTWGSYFGGSGSEVGYGCSMDGSGNIYMAGVTGSASGVSIPGTYQQTYGNSNDAFLVKIGDIGLFTSTITGSPFCTGSTISVPYTLFGTYNPANTFTAQLSDASGSFASPVNIGSVSSTAAGTISAVIPANTPAGTAYRIRVISNDPVIIGTNNGADLIINTLTPISVTLSVNPDDTICAGTSVTFTATQTGATAPTYTWYKNNSQIGGASTSTYTTAAISNNDTFKVKVSGSGCATPATDSIRMTVNPSVVPDITINAAPGTTICSGTLVTFTPTITNGTGLPSWYKKNGGTTTSLGSSATLASSTLVNNDTIYAVIAGAACSTPATDTSNYIVITVNPAITPTITLSVSPNDTICAGTSVTFTATATNGGTAVPNLSINGGAPFAMTGGTYTTSGVSNNDIFKVTLNSNATCASTATIKDSIKMTVNPVVTPTITLSVSPNDTICAGTSVTFTAATTNSGGAIPTMSINGGAAFPMTGGTYTTATVSNNDIFKVTLNSTAACASAATVNDSIKMTVSSVVNPTITLSVSPNDTICAGTSVTFTAATTNSGGAIPTMSINGGAAFPMTGGTYTTSTVANNDMFRVTLNSTAACASTATVKDSIKMTVNPVAVPTISLSVSPNDTICAGTPVTFNVATANSGGAIPIMSINGGTPFQMTGGTYTTSTVANNDIFRVTLNSTVACASPAIVKDSIKMTVNPVVTPVVTISANPGNTICAGTSVIFTATAGAGSINWYKKGNATIISTGTTFTSSTLANNDTVYAVLFSSAPCASVPYDTSNYIIMTVNPVVTPSVSIASNAGNVICAGTIVTFTATPVNGGTPTYQWSVNSGAIPGATNQTFTPGALPNGAIVTVQMTSSLCTNPPNSAVTSNSITMTVTPQVMPTVTISANPSDSVCASGKVVYTATYTNANATDTIEWKKGIITLGYGSTYTDNAPDGSGIHAVLHSSLPCAIASVVNSNIITVAIKACCDTPSNLHITFVSGNGAIFSWNAIPGVVGYEYNATQSTTNPTTGIFTTSNTNTISTLSPGSYYLYVRTYCGNGVYSPWVRIPLNGVSVHTVPADNFSISVFPNPVNEEATIQISGSVTRKTVIELTDLAGKLISTMETQNSKSVIDMRNLASGMYLLRFNDGIHNGAIKVNRQ